MVPRRSRSCPARLDNPNSGRGFLLLSCGDVKTNPGPPPTDWGGVRITRWCRICWQRHVAAWHLPCQGCLCDAGEPPLPGILDKGGRRVCPTVGLRHGGSLVGEPPVLPPGGGCGECSTRGITHADHCPGMARPPVPVVDHTVRPVPKAVAAPPGPAPLPTRWHGPDASPQVANVGLTDGLPGGVAVTHAPTSPADPPVQAPTRAGPAPGREPGRATHVGAPPHGHAALRESAREGGSQAGRATLPPRRPNRGRPYHMVGHQAPPFLTRPPHPGDTPDSRPTAECGAIELGPPAAGRTSLGRSGPRGKSGGTASDRPGSSKRGRARGRRGRPTAPSRGPDVDRPRTGTRGPTSRSTGCPAPHHRPSVDGQAGLPSQPSTPGHGTGLQPPPTLQ